MENELPGRVILLFQPAEETFEGAKDMIDAGKAELLEGAGYQSKGVYRPAEDCRMHTNKAPAFCPVCQRAISRIIEFYTE